MINKRSKDKQGNGILPFDIDATGTEPQFFIQAVLQGRDRVRRLHSNMASHTPGRNVASIRDSSRSRPYAQVLNVVASISHHH